MSLSPLSALSPIDGRYHNTTNELSAFFSESALIKYRVFVEIEYFIGLVSLPLPQLKDFPKNEFDALRKIYQNFSEADALHVKDIEKTTNHDVKAVEYFIKKKFDDLNLSAFKEFIHFGLTSQDINNTAIPYSVKCGLAESYVPALETVIQTLKGLAEQWKDVPMLARTHGQAASPTRLGKEITVFVERLEIQLSTLIAIPNAAKFGGATGNFNAHQIAYPSINWVDFANHFVQHILGLSRSQTTTQIEHYDQFAAQCDALKRINTILIDLNRDFWLYISMDYFKQELKAGEVGSSAMPHKVNPIDFENSEGNLGIANALFEHFSAKLPISRLQRDLTDSTVLRNVGVPIAHSLIALKSTQKGLSKLVLNQAAINTDLQANWAVLAEAIQTILRREGYPNPYEALKELTRTNKAIDATALMEFVNGLTIQETVKQEILQLRPETYTGI
ncbi:MAG: adenylosuccinate lyase [Sphingobacteriaceae bacterium]|nr:adenylosuccinate lyase [Sphingobacteriaceae bacterium]